MDKNLHKYQVKNTVLSHSSLHGQEPAQISGQKHCAVSFISPWTRTCTNIRSKTLCHLIHLSMDKNLHKYQVKNTVLSHSPRPRIKTAHQLSLLTQNLLTIFFLEKKKQLKKKTNPKIYSSLIHFRLNWRNRPAY